MRSRLALVLALAALPVAGASSAPTWADPQRREQVVAAVDPLGDVAINDVAGPTTP